MGWFGDSRTWGVLQARQHRADKRSPPCAESGEGGLRAIFGSHREEGTPDPIPNSVVKLFLADDTA